MRPVEGSQAKQHEDLTPAENLQLFVSSYAGQLSEAIKECFKEEPAEIVKKLAGAIEQSDD